MIENRMVIGDYYKPGDDTDEEQSNRIADIEDELCNEKRNLLIDEVINDGTLAEVCVNVLLSNLPDNEKLSELRDELNRQINLLARYLEDKNG